MLKLDIKGYFMAIDRGILYGLIMHRLNRLVSERRLPDGFDIDTVLFLLHKVVFLDPTKGCRIKGSLSDWKGLPDSNSLFNAPPGCGLPIGNLTSQLFSNIYLNELDQFCKRELGFRHYGRYVDDFYLAVSFAPAPAAIWTAAGRKPFARSRTHTFFCPSGTPGKDF